MLINIHINSIEDKSDHLNRSRKAVDKIGYYFTIEALSKLEIEERVNLIKVI